MDRQRIEVRAFKSSDESDTELDYTATGPLMDVLVPMLSSLSKDTLKRVVADAEALREGRLMPSVVEKMRKVPPRGVLKPIGEED